MTRATPHESVAYRRFAAPTSLATWLARATVIASGLAHAAFTQPPSSGAIPLPSFTALWTVTGSEVAGSDVSAGGIDAAVQSASLLHPEHAAALPVHEASLATARRDLDLARAAILEGGTSAAALQELTEAEARVAHVTAARAVALGELRRAFRDSLATQAGPDGLSLLQQMESNTHRPVPDAYKCLDLSEDAWHVLQAGLRKTEQGLAVTPDESVAIARAYSDPLVQTVARRIATNGAAVEAWFAEHARVAAASASGPAH